MKNKIVLAYSQIVGLLHSFSGLSCVAVASEYRMGITAMARAIVVPVTVSACQGVPAIRMRRFLLVCADQSYK